MWCNGVDWMYRSGSPRYYTNQLEIIRLPSPKEWDMELVPGDKY
jgi:Ni,Fe-hydrogenase III small subunit